MSKKRKNKIRVTFAGTNSSEVTGSCTWIQTSDCEILLECGLHQSNSPKDDYRINSAKFMFKPKNIDFIFLSHTHIDHAGLIPRLYRQGCRARIICPKGTNELFKILALDSAYIIDRDCESLNKKYKMKASPIYQEDDVHKALQYFEEYEYGDKIKLNDCVSFRFVPSGHILAAAQIELWLTEGSQTKKILYTGDLGNQIPKHYIVPFEPVQKANLVICESTYADAMRQVTEKDRDTDLRKIRTIIREVCMEKHGRVLFPIFSLDRTQNMLTYLYQMYGQDKDFNSPVLLDSPLAGKLTQAYLKLLSGEERKLLMKVLAWNNVKVVDTYEESVRWQHTKEPVIVLAASGFMQACVSLPASMGALIAMAGKSNPNVKTVCHPFSVGLIHSGSQYMEGTAHAVKDTFDFHNKYDELIKNYIISHTNIDEDLYEKIERKEYWMDAQEMLRLGIADEIL